MILVELQGSRTKERQRPMSAEHEHNEPSFVLQEQPPDTDRPLSSVSAVVARAVLQAELPLRREWHGTIEFEVLRMVYRAGAHQVLTFTNRG